MLHLRKAMVNDHDGGRIVAGALLGPAKTLAQIIALSLDKSGVQTNDAQTVVMTALHFTFGRVIEEQDSLTITEAKVYLHEQIFKKYPYLSRMAYE